MASDSDIDVSALIPLNASSAEREDLLLRTVLQLKVMMSSNNERLSRVEADVNLHDTQLFSLTKEVAQLKISVNAREQELKGNAIRLTGFPHVEGEEADLKLLAKKVYDRILVPIWSAAKAKGQLDAVPKLATASIDCFRVGPKPAPRTDQPRSTAQPRPVLIKFGGAPHLRISILRFKKGNIPKPSEAELAGGIRRFSIGEDLTPATYKAMKLLQESQETESVWTVEGKLRFTLVNDPKKIVKRVRSVFDHVELMISKAF